MWHFWHVNENTQSVIVWQNIILCEKVFFIISKLNKWKLILVSWWLYKYVESAVIHCFLFCLKVDWIYYQIVVKRQQIIWQKKDWVMKFLCFGSNEETMSSSSSFNNNSDKYIIAQRCVSNKKQSYSRRQSVADVIVACETRPNNNVASTLRPKPKKSPDNLTYLCVRVICENVITPALRETTQVA